MSTEEAGDTKDALVGGQAIADYIETLIDGGKVSRSKVYRWVANGFIPTQRIGALIIGSKRKIRARILGNG
jgi:hypothetical protein